MLKVYRERGSFFTRKRILPIVIYGASVRGKTYADNLLSKGYEVECFVDRSV